MLTGQSSTSHGLAAPDLSDQCPSTRKRHRRKCAARVSATILHCRLHHETLSSPVGNPAHERDENISPAALGVYYSGLTMHTNLRHPKPCFPTNTRFLQRLTLQA